ncbi:unnamed protein product [Prunus armeniaca]|uniref:Uncharacterized protein n=1 Tax=Prunus armeniaca TaxID=36596 RepID=A0A6J5VY96_PRUAR|nr:unnamed protein product [Prunus armeniaca]
MFKIRLLCSGTMLSLKEVSLSKIRIQGKSAHGPRSSLNKISNATLHLLGPS